MEIMCRLCADTSLLLARYRGNARFRKSGAILTWGPNERKAFVQRLGLWINEDLGHSDTLAWGYFPTQKLEKIRPRRSSDV